jgi:excisionase family DNA binding protein
MMLRSITETAALLGGIHEQTVRKLIRRGELVAVRIGTRVMVDDDDITDYIAAHRITTAC